MRVGRWISTCCVGTLLLACEDASAPSRNEGIAAKRAAVGKIGITELDALPAGQLSVATAINARGDIVGWATTAVEDMHAVLWRNGQITDLGTLGGTFSQAHGINDRGMVVGRATTSGGPESLESAFLWQDGSMINLGLPPGATYSVGVEVNAAGTVAVYTDAGLATWKDGVWTMLLKPSATRDCTIAGIDNAGRVAGFCVGARTRSFIWDHGVPSDVGGALGWDVVATAISPSGVITGFYFDGSDGGARPFLVRQGRFIDLITEGADPTFTPVAINGAGLAAGGIVTGDRIQHAALWRRGTVLDLGTLTGEGDSFAADLNASGHIVGTSLNASGLSRGVVWTVH